MADIPTPAEMAQLLQYARLFGETVTIIDAGNGGAGFVITIRYGANHKSYQRLRLRKAFTGDDWRAIMLTAIETTIFADASDEEPVKRVLICECGTSLPTARLDVSAHYACKTCGTKYAHMHDGNACIWVPGEKD